MNKFYMLFHNTKLYEKADEKNEQYICLTDTNLKDLEIEGIHKGWGDNAILNPNFKYPKEEIIFYYDSEYSDREIDYIENIIGWTIIHNRVKEALEINQIGGIKFYQVKLVDKLTKADNNNYYLLYVENFIDAYDKDKCECNAKNQFKVYLDETKCKYYDIFRANENPTSIYVSEKVKKIIQKNKFVGFRFKDVN